MKFLKLLPLLACLAMPVARPLPAQAPSPAVAPVSVQQASVADPDLGFAFAPAGLANVRVPVQLWAGAADQTVPYETNTAVVRRLLRGPVEFHSVPGAAHLSFLAPCGPDGPPAIRQDGPLRPRRLPPRAQQRDDRLLQGATRGTVTGDSYFHARTQADLPGSRK
jgi:predicted dienelactone hydrolase